jgi:hypothetical protein
MLFKISGISRQEHEVIRDKSPQRQSHPRHKNKIIKPKDRLTHDIKHQQQNIWNVVENTRMQ